MVLLFLYFFWDTHNFLYSQKLCPCISKTISYIEWLNSFVFFSVFHDHSFIHSFIVSIDSFAFFMEVWDLSRSVPEYTVTTMASVGRIKWRPQKTYHIASCALVIDSSIHVWDIRRPYIPHASFNDHKDITTGIAWKGGPDVLLSTSKVCLFRFILSYQLLSILLVWLNCDYIVS